MLYGLTVQEITILVSLVFGVLVLIAGFFLLVIYPDLRVPSELEAPSWLGGFKVKAPVPAVMILVACLLIGFPLWNAFLTQPKLPVSGKVELGRGRTVSGILVGVLPSSQVTLTQPDGRYFLHVPRGERGIQYQAVVYLPNSKPMLFHTGIVKFDADGQGSFDHAFTGKETK